MHFVKKEPTTEEQRAAKEKIRVIKVQKYLVARNRIFEKTNNSEYDSELLALIQGVLSKNPDITTFWNFRRKTINLLISQLEKQESFIPEIEKLLNVELALTLECLMEANPKSYGAWFHRGWTLEKFLSTGCQPDFKAELLLCKKALDLDCRNFHCWDHRRIVSKLANCTKEEELKFTLDRIDHNFSNYSAWHYRSVLLPQVQQGETLQLSDEFIAEELERVTNAICCDTNDQSAYVYIRWLLSLDTCKRFVHPASNEVAIPLSITFNHNRITIVMTKATSVDELLNFIDDADKSLFKAHSAIAVNAKTAIVWTYSSQLSKKARLRKDDDWKIVESDSPLVRKDLMKIIFDCDTVRQSRIAAAVKEKMELVMSVPPISAWTSYTYALTLIECDPVKHHEKIIEILQDLALNSDTMRSELYESLISQQRINQVLRKVGEDGKQLLDHLLDGDEKTLNLSRLGLKSLSNIHFLAGFLETLYAADNKIVEFEDILLPNLELLDLSENPVVKIPLLSSLQHLKSLNIAATAVESIADILPALQSLQNLDKLIFPETKIVDSAAEIREGLKKDNIRLINYWL